MNIIFAPFLLHPHPHHPPPTPILVPFLLPPLLVLLRICLRPLPCSQPSMTAGPSKQSYSLSFLSYFLSLFIKPVDIWFKCYRA